MTTNRSFQASKEHRRFWIQALQQIEFPARRTGLTRYAPGHWASIPCGAWVLPCDHAQNAVLYFRERA
jgi:hypothetical protein